MVFDRKAYQRAYREAHREEHRASNRGEANKARCKARYQAKKQEYIANAAARAALDPAAEKQRLRERYAANAEQERQLRREHYAANKAAYVARAKLRKALLCNRVPVWADRAAIAAVYAKAAEIKRDIGVEVHVDHIVPLQGRRVSGLHVANNLRIVTAEENMRKRNNLIEELV